MGSLFEPLTVLPPDLVGEGAAQDGASAPGSPDEGSATLGLDVDDAGSTVTVRLRGELDLATSGLLQGVLERLLRQRRTPRVDRLVVDTAQVSFIDAAGVSPLLHARAVLARRGGAFVLPSASSAVARLLTLLGLAELLEPSPA
ncbi:STAS domain-containing protein [Motilibacter deserti]|uniref:Anti-sigma factor antagonist n=1 Tax=Motilibacter deserti TaxID=2714956 RepID=A0ABX0GRB5_9ACTN|nr:STAS domain-containing protein [Motilibacter deserti]NHC13408.1 STAS domain-containing protein [Motilibacter deserti]